MSINDNILKLKEDIKNAYAAVEEKGGNIPQNKNTNNLSEAIGSIKNNSASEDNNSYFYTDGIAESGGTSSSGINMLIKKCPPGITVNRDARYFFYLCTNLKDLTDIFDTSKVSNMNGMFSGCKRLEEILSFNTSSATYMSELFFSCKALKKIPALNCHYARDITNMCYYCTDLEEVGGFQNLGEAYGKNQSSNYSKYTLSLIQSEKLTEQSLIAILNSVYNIAEKGIATQSIKVGTTNLAKLSSEAGQQALIEAQEKGWTIS